MTSCRCFVLALTLAACAGPPCQLEAPPPTPPPPTVPVGLVVIPPGYDASAAGFGAVVTQASAAKVAFLSFGYAQWRAQEPSPGVFDFGEMSTFFEAVGDQDIDYVLDVSTPMLPAGIDVPADLTFTDFASAELRERYGAYLEAVARWAPARTKAVTLHVEGAVEYLAEHPAHRQGLCDFVAEAIARMKAARPGVEVGVYWRYEDQDVALRTCVTGTADYLGLAFILNPPSTTLGQTGRIVDEVLASLPAGQRLALVEVGWPSSERLGSSEACQADFVDLVMAQASRDRVAFFSYYTVFDEDPAVARQWIDAAFPQMSEDSRADLAAWVGSLGLQRADFTPKPGWERFLRAVGAQ